MQISERRKKILDIFNEKGPLSYKEILDEMSGAGEDIDILSDLDTLVSFKFLQHVKSHRKSELKSKTQLELRPRTITQIKNNPPKIHSRIKEIEHEIPPWHRKLAVLTVLNSRKMEPNEIFETVRDQYPQARWSRPLVKASLKILEESKHISAEKRKETEWYTLTSSGTSLLENSPFQQFLTLGELKDEFTAEFRAFEILNLVKDNNGAGISSGRITRHFQSKYGIRGNKRKAIRNTLKNMVFSELLRVTEGTEKRGGHVYHLGKTAERLLLGGNQMNIKDNHSIQDFKETVEQFFREYEIFDIKRDDKSSIEQTLDDLEQCKLDLSLRLPEEWAAHIVFLTDHLRHVKADTWEGRAFQCISACILSRLLPPEVSVHILKDYPPPDTPPEELHHFYIGIAREYYFNLTEAYFDLKEYEKAFQSFNYLELLSWKSFDFFILKGRIRMLQCDMRKTSDAREVLDAFKNALKMSKGKERVIALFYMGLAQYRRGDFKMVEKVKPTTPEQEERYKELEKRMKPKTHEEEWERKGAKEIWESCLKMPRTVDQEIVVRHNLANVYRMLGDLEKARENYERIIVLADNDPEKEEFKVKSLIGLANVLIDQCSWDKAEEKLKETIQECTEKFPPVAAFAEMNLGVLLGRKGKYEEALACYKEALLFVNKKDNPREYGTIFINRGDAFRHLKRMDEAMAAFKEAETAIGTKNTIPLLALELSKADLFIDMGDLEEGWRLSRSVLQEAWLDNKRLEAEAKRIQGTVLFRKNEFYRARKSLEESEKIFGNLGLQYELLDVYALLEACCQHLKYEEQEVYRGKREDLLKRIGLSE